jgi:hypothetical protein
MSLISLAVTRDAVGVPFSMGTASLPKDGRTSPNLVAVISVVVAQRRALGVFNQRGEIQPAPLQ